MIFDCARVTASDQVLRRRAKGAVTRRGDPLADFEEMAKGLCARKPQTAGDILQRVAIQQEPLRELKAEHIQEFTHRAAEGNPHEPPQVPGADVEQTRKFTRMEQGFASEMFEARGFELRTARFWRR
jgi:hypothetical protein